jgi:hypothetical protein
MLNDVRSKNNAHHEYFNLGSAVAGLYKNNPLVTSILSGLGAGLQKDDYNDFKEWPSVNLIYNSYNNIRTIRGFTY